MRRDVPIWLDRFPTSRRPAHPRLRGEHTVDVVIVGGGLTGCACAAAFAGAGVGVSILEADRIGAASTAGSPGFIREDFDASFLATADAHGLRAARTLWLGQRRAALDLAAAIKRYDVKCDLVAQDLLQVVPREADAVKRLRREYDARRAAGFEHSWMTAAATARAASLDAGAAIRTRGFVFDPFRACLGLADVAVDRGAAFFERTPARRIRVGRKGVDVVTESGTVHAQAVIVATAAPLPDLRALRRHLHPKQSYVVVTEPLPAPVRRELGARASALRDASSPPHFLRWLKDDRALFSGADHAPVAARAQEKLLVQHAGQLMYELSVLYPAISGARAEWSWGVTHDTTTDGLPYIGAHRNFPRHLFALGHGRHGAALSWLSARLLLRAFQGTPDKGDELFGFSRILK